VSGCRRAAAGYTLVELLVVAAIVGMLVVTAALAWRSDPARTLEAEARHLAGRLELAQARTRITGDRIAFSTSADGYLFWLRDDNGMWREIEGDAGLTRRTLVQGIRVRALQLSGIALAHGQRVAFVADEDAALTVTLEGSGSIATVASGPYAGQMSVRTAGGMP